VGVAWGQARYPYLIKVDWMVVSGPLAGIDGYTWYFCLFGIVFPVRDVKVGES
jgi:hypothetical protein